MCCKFLSKKRGKNSVAYTVKYALGAIFLSNISVSYHICTCMLHVCTVSLSLYCTAGYRIILYVLCSPNVICFSHKTERRQLERKEGGTRFMLHLLYTLPFLNRAEGSFCAVNNQLGKTRQITKNQKRVKRIVLSHSS
jgi:hypothetical protein